MARRRKKQKEDKSISVPLLNATGTVATSVFRKNASELHQLKNRIDLLAIDYLG